MDNNINSVEETKTEENKIEESVSQTESTVKTEEPKKGKSNNMILIILLVVILLVGAGLSYYLLIVKQHNSNPNNNGTTTTTSATGNDETTTVVTGDNGTTTTTTSAATTTTTAVKVKNEIEVIDLQGPCINGRDCNKEIKDIKLGGKTLKLSVDFKKFNIEGASGDIILGDKKKNIEGLLSRYPTKTILSFGVYKDYLLVYTQDWNVLHTYLSDDSDCEVKEYTIYILDADLTIVGFINGESEYDPADVVKIANNYVYFSELNRTRTTGVTLQNFKVLFDKVLSNDFNSSEYISDDNTCINMYKE